MSTSLMPALATEEASAPRTAEEAIDRAVAIAAFAADNAATLDRTGAFPAAEFARLRAAGLLAAPLPRTHGGLGLGTEPGLTAPLLRLLAHLGRGSLPVGRVYEGHVNALQLIHSFGTPQQLTRFAQDAHDGRIFAVWNAGAADDVRLERLPDGSVRMIGAKTFCSGGDAVTRPFVPGPWTDGSGWQMILVPMERVTARHDPSWWTPNGMRASVSYKIDFTDVVLPPDCLVGGPGDYLRQPAFSGGAIRFAAVQLGGGQALYDAARRYLRGMKRTDDPYQVQRAAQMTLHLEGARLFLERAAALHDDPARTADEIVAWANLTRTAVEQACMETITAVERTVGVRGLMPPLPMERIIRDLTVYLRQPAPDAAFAGAGRHYLDAAPYYDPLMEEDANGE